MSGLLSTFLFVFFFKQKTAYEMRISDWSSDVCSSDLSGDYDVNELYVEFNVPLMRDGWLGKSLDLSLAERYSDYSTFGGESTGKIGLRWQVADELLLRGSFAEGFRAPSIGELSEIGRASCRERCVSTCRSRWSPYHKKKKMTTN